MAGLFQTGVPKNSAAAATMSPFSLLAPPITVASMRGVPAGGMGARVEGAAPGSSGSVAVAGPYSGPYANTQFVGEPFAVWIGMVFLLVLLGWYGNHKDTLSGVDPGFIKGGFYNLFTIGISASVFIAALKIFANRFPFPGVTEFANAL